MAHRLTTAPVAQILTAADARVQCRIDDNGQDTDLNALIKRATRHCEDICKRAFITQTWTLTMDGFYDRRYWDSCGVIYVPRPPLISVTSVTYLASDGTSTTLASDQYRVDATNEPGRIEPAYGVSWPSTRGVVGDVTIVHTCGYGAAATSVPEPIHHAVAMLVAHWALNREAVLIGSISKALEHAVEDLLSPYMMEIYA